MLAICLFQIRIVEAGNVIVKCTAENPTFIGSLSVCVKVECTIPAKSLFKWYYGGDRGMGVCSVV